MTLKQLAKKNGISLATAKRYLRDGIDLRDAEAVEGHKEQIRTRRGLGKRSHRAEPKTSRTSEPHPEMDPEKLHVVIWHVHFRICALRSKHPELDEELTAILKETSPIVSQLGW